MRRVPDDLGSAFWILASFTWSCWVLFLIFVVITSLIIYLFEHWHYINWIKCIEKYTFNFKEKICPTHKEFENTRKSVELVYLKRHYSVSNDNKIEPLISKKDRMTFKGILGNTMAAFRFGGDFRLKCKVSGFMLNVVKLWVLIMSSFYMANL